MGIHPRPGNKESRFVSEIFHVRKCQKDNILFGSAERRFEKEIKHSMTADAFCECKVDFLAMTAHIYFSACYKKMLLCENRVAKDGRKGKRIIAAHPYSKLMCLVDCK